MIKTGNALAGLEFFPSAGIDLAGDALSVEKIFCQKQARGFQTQIFYVVIPARMLAKGRHKNLRRLQLVPAVFRQKGFREIAHYLGQGSRFKGWVNLTFKGRNPPPFSGSTGILTNQLVLSPCLSLCGPYLLRHCRTPQLPMSSGG